MPTPSAQCVRLFADKGGEKVYSALLKGLRSRVNQSLVFEDLKSTCVHINAGKDGTAYAGVHPRTGGALLNIRLAEPLRSKRVRKNEQVSRNRCHCEVLLSNEDEVDDELLGWLEEAARLVTQPKVNTKKATRRRVSAS